jgi:1-phosphatidylinositol-4-phosphate 5-kinase
MNAPESDSENRSPTSLDTIQIGKNGETIKLPTKKQTAGKEKIGHRRVNKVTGEVTYKKTASSSISGAIQLGIAHSVGQLSKAPMRDILMQDFEVVEIVNFPSNGTTLTPQHDHGDFTFQTIAPLGMRFFRDIFNISVQSFLNSIAAEPLIEISNPGASGSLFWYDVIPL